MTYREIVKWCSAVPPGQVTPLQLQNDLMYTTIANVSLGFQLLYIQQLLDKKKHKKPFFLKF